MSKYLDMQKAGCFQSSPLGTSYEASQELAATGKTLGVSAVFCVNDLLAFGVLQALYAARIAVPDEIAVVGYDDIEFAAATAVPLTSVRQPALELGRPAAALLLGETGDNADLHTHQRVVLQPELVTRESTGQPSRP